MRLVFLFSFAVFFPITLLNLSWGGPAFLSSLLDGVVLRRGIVGKCIAAL